jgi:putative glycerol-1-phosphate prenyltransferase
MPIPNDKNDIAVSTALAGQYLGLQLIYLEAGSGAEKPVSVEMIQAVKKNIDIPLIVGGGIRTESAFRAALQAGADVVVTGNILEKNVELMKIFYNCLTFRTSM